MARSKAAGKQKRATVVVVGKPAPRSASIATRAQATRTLTRIAEALAEQAAAAREVTASNGRRPAGKTVAKGATRGAAGGTVAGKRTAGRPATKPAATKHADAQRRGGRTAPAPERIVRIRELDPYTKCGPDTSVTELYRVDEAVNGAKHVHLVFFDRHGWYCMHGRACPAVNDVRRMERAHSVRTH